MLELLVVRHGQSIADIENRFEGRANYELTNLGIAQAKQVAIWIQKHYKPDVIIISPLKRAQMTAELISNECGMQITFEDEIMEWNNGLLAGLKREEGIKKYPPPPGGRKPHDTYAETESHIQFRARAETFLSRLLDENDNYEMQKRICVVSHGGFINMLFRSFLRLPVDIEVTISNGDTGVHLWQVNGRDRKIIFSNYQEHLRGLV